MLLLAGLYFLCWALLIDIALRSPWVLLRPSVWFALLMMVTICGAAAFTPDSYAYPRGPTFESLETLALFRVLTLLFPLAIVGVAHLTPTWSREAKCIYSRCRSVEHMPSRRACGSRERCMLLVMLGVGMTVLAGYLHHVPLQRTGLWAIVYDPANSALAREESLTLVESPFVRYGYSWYRLLIVPICVGLIWLPVKKLPSARFVFAALVGLALVLTAMLTGERSSGAKVLVFLGIAYVLKRGIRKGGVPLCLAVFVACSLAAILSITREGKFGELSTESFSAMIVRGIFARMFLGPFATGVYTNIYAQDIGLLGLSNIRPLATVFGADYVHLANVAGLYAFPHALESTGMNTCFLFDFQASFGSVPGFVVSVVVICLLDAIMLSYRRLSGILLVVLYALQLLTILSLTSSGFSTCLNTHGVLWVPIIAIAASCMLGRPRDVGLSRGGCAGVVRFARARSKILGCDGQIAR
jgi:hypothetical protein